MALDVSNGLFALGGAAVTGLFVWWSARIEHKKERRAAAIRRLSAQVEAYYQLEQLYVAKLSSIDSAQYVQQTVQRAMREEVEKLGAFVRPTMTATEARKLREELE